jgi:SAM-dependent methyltransferase
MAEKSVVKANAYLNRFNIKGKAIVGDVKRLKFPDNYFDKVVSSDFYEHLNFEDNVAVLKEVLRVLKPYGLLAIKTPNITYLKLSLWFKRMMALIKFRNPFRIVIPHTVSIKGESPEHVGLSSRVKIMKALNLAGFNNYKFYYSRNSKIDRISPFISEVLSCEIPLLRDALSEDVIVVARKSVILYGF